MRLFSLCCLLIAVWPTIAGAGEFKAGAAAVAITPAAGTPLAGYYQLRASEGVSDEIYAKAIVVEQDGVKAAFVALDLITVTRPVVVGARRLIAAQIQIAPERVMISATHSHTGPVLARDSKIDELTGGNTPLATDFTGGLPELIARSVAQANAKLAPARVSAAVGREENLSFNRRYWMQDGKVAWNPPKLDARIVKAAGPIDPDVGVLFFESTAKDAAPLATYVNFAMHPDTVGGLKVSADYPFYLARRLAEYKGPEMLTFFANGCCGNINHRNAAWADPQRGQRESERIGTTLAAAVFKTWPALRPLTTTAPRAATAMVRLPLPTFTAAEVEEAQGIARRMSDPKIGTVAKAKAFCILDIVARNDAPQEVEVQVMSFSDEVAIVSLPGEIFVELGLAVKKSSPFKHTLIAELANGSIGYIPNRTAYAEGNYEVVSARCAEGSGELLVEAAVKLLKELRAPR